MHTLALLTQLLVAAAVFCIWILRFDNLAREFDHFGYSTIFRNAVGVVKLVLATLLVVGIWMPALVMGAAIGMGILMLGAQWSHARVGNPVAKRLPSALFLALSVFQAVESAGLLG